MRYINILLLSLIVLFAEYHDLSAARTSRRQDLNVEVLKSNKSDQRKPPVQAENQADKKAEAAAKAKYPKKWWLVPAMKIGYLPERWLVHGELSYSGVRVDGNRDISRHDVNGSLIVRKKNYTNYFSVKSSYRKEVQVQPKPVFDVTSPNFDPNNPKTILGVTTETTYDKNYNFTVDNRLLHGISKRLYVGGGLSYTEDLDRGVDSRKSAYAGVGYVFIDKPQYGLLLKTLGGYIREDEETLLGVQEDANRVFMNINFNFAFSRSIAFMNYIDVFQKVGDDQSYRYVGIATLLLRSSKHVSTTLSYKSRYNSAPLNPSTIKRDKILRVGLELSF